MNYDIVAGLDNPTLNQVVGQVYAAVYPSLFRNSISIDEVGIESLGFDFDAAPTVTLQPSSALRERVGKLLSGGDEGFVNLRDEERERIASQVAAASFGLVAPSLKLTVNYSSGAPASNVAASLTGAVSIQTSGSGGQDFLEVQLVSATISIPADPVLEQLLNSAIVPAFLIPYLNTNILSPIQVPALQFEGITVSMPVPVVQSPFVTAYSALGSTQPDIPAPGSWPTSCVFVGVDTSVLGAAAAIPFPLGPSTGFNWDIISGTVGAQVTAPTNISINSDGSISATLTAYAKAQLTLHTPSPLPNVSFGPDAEASISATFKPSVVGGKVCVVLEGVPIPTFSFSWGIPSWINWLFEPLEAGLAAALNAVLGPLLGNVLNLPPIPVYTIPNIQFSLAGKSINVNINSATTSAQSSLLMVSAQAQVTSGSTLMAWQRSEQRESQSYYAQTDGRSVSAPA